MERRKQQSRRQTKTRQMDNIILRIKRQDKRRLDKTTTENSKTPPTQVSLGLRVYVGVSVRFRVRVRVRVRVKLGLGLRLGLGLGLGFRVRV